MVEGGGFQILTFDMGGTVLDLAWVDTGGGMLLYLLEGGAISEARGS